MSMTTKTNSTSPVTMFDFNQTDVPLRCRLPVFNNTCTNTVAMDTQDTYTSHTLPNTQNDKNNGCVQPKLAGHKRHTSFMHPPPFKRRKPNQSNHCFRRQPITIHDHLIDCVIQSAVRHKQKVVIDLSSCSENFNALPGQFGNTTNDPGNNTFANGTLISTPITRRPVLQLQTTSNNYQQKDTSHHFNTFAYHTASAPQVHFNPSQSIDHNIRHPTAPMSRSYTTNSNTFCPEMSTTTTNVINGSVPRHPVAINPYYPRNSHYIGNYNTGPTPYIRCQEDHCHCQMKQ
eukprot:169630_1